MNSLICNNENNNIKKGRKNLLEHRRIDNISGSNTRSIKSNPSKIKNDNICGSKYILTNNFKNDAETQKIPSYNQHLSNIESNCNESILLFNKIFSLDKNYELNENIINSAVNLLSQSKNNSTYIHFLNILKSHIGIYFWNPTYNKIYEEALNIFQIQNVDFILNMVVNESYSIIKIKSLNSILSLVIDKLQFDERFLIISKNIFSNIESFYKKEEIDIIVKILTIISTNSASSYTKSDFNNENLNLIMKLSMMEIIKALDCRNFVKILKNKNSFLITLTLIKFKVCEFLTIFEKYLINPFIKIKSNSQNIESLHSGLDFFDFEVINLNENNQFITFANSEKGCDIIQEILLTFDIDKTSKIYRFLVKIKNEKNQNKVKLDFLNSEKILRKYSDLPFLNDFSNNDSCYDTSRHLDNNTLISKENLVSKGLIGISSKKYTQSLNTMENLVFNNNNLHNTGKYFLPFSNLAQYPHQNNCQYVNNYSNQFINNNNQNFNFNFNTNDFSNNIRNVPNFSIYNDFNKKDIIITDGKSKKEDIPLKKKKKVKKSKIEKVISKSKANDEITICLKVENSKDETNYEIVIKDLTLEDKMDKIMIDNIRNLNHQSNSNSKLKVDENTNDSSNQTSSQKISSDLNKTFSSNKSIFIDGDIKADEDADLYSLEDINTNDDAQEVKELLSDLIEKQ